MKVGVLGVGSIGSRHLANLHTLPGLDVVAYDPGQPGVLGSEEAFWRAKPEAVFVCTPPDSHFRLALEALHNHCHVFCEKPLAREAWQADTLVGSARKMNRLLSCGYNLRYQLDAFRAQAEGQNVAWHYAGNMAAWPSRYQKDALEECSHEIDCAVWVNGPVQSVAAVQRDAVWHLSLRHFEAISTITLATHEAVGLRAATTATGVTWTFDHEANLAAYLAEARDFLAACRTGQLDGRLCRGVEAAHTVGVIEACRESARDFKIVRLR